MGILFYFVHSNVFYLIDFYIKLEKKTNPLCCLCNILRYICTIFSLRCVEQEGNII